MSSSMTYELSCVLDGHRGDVLGLLVTHDDRIVSCSRDGTAKSWLREKSTGKYTLYETYSAAEQSAKLKFLTCICVIAPNDSFPKGLIVAGSNTNVILVFEPDSPVPFQHLRGHNNSVSKLVNGFETNVLLSASWDATVKVWRMSPQVSECIRTIEFPRISVWAILQTKRNLICVGTADKMVHVFGEDDKLLRSLIGHEECVRDLVELNYDEILSCSNDATIRRWSVTTGMCLEILYGHPNYIYSVRVFDDLIVGCGEDRCLLIWKEGRHFQTITLPARSVWSVAFLSNEDIVVGSSDGVIRIFSLAKERQASQETLEAFRKACSNFVVPFQKHKASTKLSGLSALNGSEENRAREGQSKIVHDNDKMIYYSWSVEEEAWKNVGNVDTNMSTLSKTSNHSNNQETSSTEQTVVYICALCRQTFSRKCILRRHVQKTSHSITNQVPAYLRSVLPKDWHYYVTKFSRKGTQFKAEICLTTINGVKEVHEWIREFSNQNRQMYRRNSTKKNTSGQTAYTEFYRCQYARVSRKSKVRSFDGKECKSTIHVAIKRDPLALSNYTKLNLNFVHNHLLDDEFRTCKPYKPSAEVKEKFRLMFENGVSPIAAFCMFKQELGSRNESSSVCTRDSRPPNFNWVKSYYRSLYGDTIEETRAQAESIMNTRDANGKYIVPDDVDMTSESETVHDSDDELDDDELLKTLQKRFDHFMQKLEEEDEVKYFKTGILSMCSELKKARQASPQRRLSALLSFNKPPGCR